MCDLFAGLASVGQVLYETTQPPGITKVPDVTGTGPMKYLPAARPEEFYVWGPPVSKGGCEPMTWTAEFAETDPPPGLKSPLPEGLEIDAKTGMISGTIDSLKGGRPFLLVVSDDYGPAFKYVVPLEVGLGVLHPGGVRWRRRGRGT